MTPVTRIITAMTIITTLASHIWEKLISNRIDHHTTIHTRHTVYILSLAQTSMTQQVTKHFPQPMVLHQRKIHTNLIIPYTLL